MNPTPGAGSYVSTWMGGGGIVEYTPTYLAATLDAEGCREEWHQN
jgi:hypothetical protein